MRLRPEVIELVSASENLAAAGQARARAESDFLTATRRFRDAWDALTEDERVMVGQAQEGWVNAKREPDGGVTPDDFLDAAEVAERLCVSEKTVWDWWKRGVLSGVRPPGTAPGTALRLFRRSEVERLRRDMLTGYAPSSAKGEGI